MWMMIILICLSIIWCYRRTSSSIRRHIRRWPGPLGLPFIGILLKIGNFGVFHQTLTRWNKKYGKMFRFKLLGRRSVVLRSASVMERALDNVRLTGRKSPFFQKYVFNNKSFAFANYEGEVPKMRHMFTQALYWDWELRELGDFGLELCVKKLKRRLLHAGKSGYSPDIDIRNLMADIFTCLEYVFENKGFGFGNLDARASCQKRVLTKYLQRQETDSHSDALYDDIDNLISAFKCAGKQDEEMNDFLKPFFTDHFTKQLIGETLPESDPDYNVLWEFIDLLYTLLEPGIDGPLKAFPFLRFLPGKYGRIFRETIKARDRVAKRYFESQKATYQEGIIRGLVDVCLKTQADDISESGSSWLTDDYIKGLMYDTLAAGMTEMMKTLRLLILLMCHHQDCQRHVQQEIDDVIGHLDKPTANHRHDMPYTEAVIMEMMRYVSQTPLAIPHKCNKDVILDGYLIEKDSGIFPNLWGIHHDESVWGDPWEFRPERFLGDDNKILPPDHELMHSFIPFSVGKRRCPGQNFAMSRTFVIFTSLLQQIHFLPPEEEELPSADPRLYTTKYPLYLPPFKCKAVQRTS